MALAELIWNRSKFIFKYKVNLGQMLDKKKTRVVYCRKVKR